MRQRPLPRRSDKGGQFFCRLLALIEGCWLCRVLMEIMLTVFLAALPVFALLLAGALCRRRGILTEAAEAGLLQLIVKLLYPALILKYVVGNPALEDSANLLWPPLAGFLMTVAGYAIAWYAGPLLGLRVGKGQRTFAFTTGITNYGYIPIPLIASLFESRETLGVLLVHNVGVEVALWVVGILMITGDSSKGLWRKILNPPVIALLCGLLLNSLNPGEFTGAAGTAYGVVQQVIGLFAGCAVPLGLLVSGAVLADLWNEPGWLREWRVVGGALVLRLGVLPVLMLTAAFLLPFSLDLQRVLVVQAAMPAAMLPIALSRHFGGSPRVAVQVVLGTTLVSFLTIPLWMTLGLRFLEG